MTATRETRGSDYMHWAKTRSSARFNLATSGLRNVKLSELNVSVNDLEITGVSGYGYEPLQKAIAGRLGVGIGTIVTAAGTSLANHLAMAALVEPGDEVLIEQPTYEPLLALARYLGANISRFQRRFEHRFQILPADIEQQVSPRTRLIVITNHHNPTGVLTDEATMKQVGEIARRVNARVLVDEVYLESLFDERPRTAYHFGPEFITTGSLTKAFGLSGLRCGWIVAEPELAQQVWRLNDLFAATPVHAGERLSVIAFQQLAQLGRDARMLLETNRRMLNEFLDSRHDLETIRTDSGTIMFPRLRSGQTTDRFCQLLRGKYETSVVPGKFFEMPAHFRVGMGGDSETMAQGLRRLGSALDEL
jgi:aspartate/methionine/tyrosine aminotransferase